MVQLQFHELLFLYQFDLILVKTRYSKDLDKIKGYTLYIPPPSAQNSDNAPNSPHYYVTNLDFVGILFPVHPDPP